MIDNNWENVDAGFKLVIPDSSGSFSTQKSQFHVTMPDQRISPEWADPKVRTQETSERAWANEWTRVTWSTNPQKKIQQFTKPILDLLWLVGRKYIVFDLLGICAKRKKSI